MLKIPYGNAYFAEIRREGFFYVDKTPFLPELESAEAGYKNLLFLRPRRFGKSLLISMMEHYYDISLAHRYDELFKGLWIYDHPTPEKSKYMVLRFDFSPVVVDGGVDALKLSFLNVVKNALETFGGRYGDRNKRLDRFLTEEMNQYTEPGDLVSKVLSIVAGSQEDSLYVMIDEYDSFAVALLAKHGKNIYNDVTDSTGFVRAFYRALKMGTQTSAITRIFITGGTPVLLDDLVSGFNIATNISTKWRFNELAGFTPTDVERAVDELLLGRPELAGIEGVSHRATLIDTLTRHYDGYLFSADSTTRMFNSNLVLYFLKELADRGKYPAEMRDRNGRTDYKKLHALWSNIGPGSDERRHVVEDVLSHRTIRSTLVDQFGADDTRDFDEFVSLLFYSGMLTLAPDPSTGTRYSFEVPNRVIRTLGWEHYALLLQEMESIPLMDRPVVDGLEVMVLQSNIEPFVEAFRTQVLPRLSCKDLGTHDEKAMKMLLIGAMATANMFYVLSEKECAQGFADLLVTPLPSVPIAKDAWLIELKYLAENERGREVAIVKEAEDQLRKYMSDQQMMDVVCQGKGLKAGTMVFIGGKELVWRPFGWAEEELKKPAPVKATKATKATKAAKPAKTTKKAAVGSKETKARKTR